jgi:hypothetical protein
MADGEWISAPIGEFQKDTKMEIVYKNGRPSYFQESTVDSNDAMLETHTLEVQDGKPHT